MAKPKPITLVTRLDQVAHELEKIHNVIVVCDAALHGQNAEQDTEIANVLKANVSAPLFAVMMELSTIMVRLRDHKASKNLT
jgi:hypothetical protein